MQMGRTRRLRSIDGSIDFGRLARRNVAAGALPLPESSSLTKHGRTRFPTGQHSARTTTAPWTSSGQCKDPIESNSVQIETVKIGKNPVEEPLQDNGHLQDNVKSRSNSIQFKLKR